MRKSICGLFIAFVFLAVSGVANAVSIPGNIDTIQTFLNSTYFNGYGQIDPTLTFSGSWEYTTIASEAGHANVTESPNNSTPNFTNQNTSNWGTFKTVDFDSGNIFFSDLIDGPVNVALNPFVATGAAGFKLFVLTDDSNPLTYLLGNLILPKGTIIVGWNDNLSNQNNDADYDDMIIAMKPVPEPTTMLLLGFGLIGLATVSHRRFR